MNIKIDIEMTPEELRRFFGLPDVAKMQDAITDRMKETILDKMAEQGLPEIQTGIVEQSFKAMEAYQKMFLDALDQSSAKKSKNKSA
jgi:hypothetical protein